MSWLLTKEERERREFEKRARLVEAQMDEALASIELTREKIGRVRARLDAIDERITNEL